MTAYLIGEGKKDPYHFLQFDKPEVDTLDENFLQNFCQALTPTFLSMDVDGRVLRSDR